MPPDHPHEENKGLAIRSVWIIWAVFAICMLLLQASTVDVLPSLMQDEAQITDYGRLALDPLSRWSVTWWVAGDKPLLLWSYIGPVLAELGYQIGGTAGVGPRVVALVGGLVAATVAFAWLMGRKVPPMIAGLLATAFLLDPLFTLSQRMARTDSWVMAFCLASCLALRLSVSKKGFPRISLLILAGMLAAAASFVWPSALFLYPLICLEFFQSFYDQSDAQQPIKKLAQTATYFLLAGFFTSILLLVPIQHQINGILEDMRNMVALNVNTSKSPVERISMLFNHQPWVKMMKAFVKTLSPFLPAMALWAIIFRRERSLIFVSAITLIVIFLTLIYEFRLLYLMPYFLALTGNLFRVSTLKPLKPLINRLSVTFLLLMVIWSFGVTIFLRSVIALNEGEQRKRALIEEAAKSSIGKGNYKVFLAFTYELYYTGRSLGWQLYTPYIQFSYDDEGNWIRKDAFQPKDKFLQLMSGMDYAIFAGNEIDANVGRQLDSAGLHYAGRIQVGTQSLKGDEISSFGNIGAIFSWYLQGAPGYGPYLLFARAANQSARPKLVSKKQ